MTPIRGTDIKQLRGRGAYRTSSSRNDPILKEIHFFLESFGQTNRQSSERSNDGAITQAVQLMNSPLVHRQIKATEGSYLAGLLKQEIRMTRGSFGVRALPGPTANADRGDRREGHREERSCGWEDLQWLLVNRVEFVHNF